jgi:hypothetical protein
MLGAGSTRAPVAGPEELTVLRFVRPASPASPARPSSPSHPQLESSSSRSTACAGAAVLGAPAPGEVGAVFDCAIAAPPTARVAITDKTRVRCIAVTFRSRPFCETRRLATRFNQTNCRCRGANGLPPSRMERARIKDLRPAGEMLVLGPWRFDAISGAQPDCANLTVPIRAPNQKRRRSNLKDRSEGPGGPRARTNQHERSNAPKHLKHAKPPSNQKSSNKLSSTGRSKRSHRR